MPTQILFYGNCQVKYIARVFNAQIAPFTGDTAQYCDINFTDFNNPHHQKLFAETDVLVDQVFDVDDPIPHGLLNPKTPRLRIPNMRGDFLWPYGTRALPPHHASLPESFYYAHEYGDTFLNRMLAQAVPPDQAVRAYMDVDFTKQRNLPRIFEISMDRQARRDQISGISVCRDILDNFRAELLFMSPGHPAERLLHAVAKPVLQELADSDSAARALAAQFHGFDHWRVVPIHPNAAQTLGLGFISKYMRYQVFDEGFFTFAEYALRYMRGEHVAPLRAALRRYAHIDPQAMLDLTAAALQQAPLSPLAYRLRAQAFRNHKRPAQALDAALRAANLEPENPHNAIEVIHALLQADEPSSAEAWARLAVARFPREASLFHALCEALMATGQYADVADHAATAAALHPGHVHGLLRSARYLIAARQFDQAETLLNQALKREPASTEAAHIRTQLAQKRAQAATQAKTIDAATARRQKDASLHAQLGQLLLVDNDAAGAEGHYRQALALDPTSAEIRRALADTLTRQGRHTEAAALLPGT